MTSRYMVIEQPEQPRVCSIDYCENLVVSKGFCRRHYNSMKYHGDPLRSDQLSQHIKSSYKPCSVPSCKAWVRTAGYCGRHYKSFLKYGDPLKASTVRNYTRSLGDPCLFPGCNRSWDSKGYCSGHFQQLRCGKELKPLRKQKRYTIEEKADPNFIYRCRQSWRRGMLRFFGNKCCVCGYSVTITCHHIVPVFKGGLHTIRNGIVLCPNHHAEVHKVLGHKIPQTWLDMRSL